MRSKQTKSMSLFLIVICGSDANLNEVLFQQAPLYAVPLRLLNTCFAESYCCECYFLLWKMSPPVPSTAALFEWLEQTQRMHAPVLVAVGFFFFVSANRLTSSSGQIECARSDFCRETLFSHCSAMWLTSSSFCSQLFCVFNSVTS